MRCGRNGRRGHYAEGGLNAHLRGEAETGRECFITGFMESGRRAVIPVRDKIVISSFGSRCIYRCRRTICFGHGCVERQCELV